jgi:lipoprotein NlpI|tara:strand:+ start:6917 stop:7372 length:456 start_codon:yes stop_codon:yes gene_type:complete
MAQKDRNYKPLISYLERRDISPQEAMDIIQASTPEGKEDNKKFNWKMLRFTMFIWKRVEQDKNGNLLSKTKTARDVVTSKNYGQMYEAFNSKKLDPKKEAFNLFKLVTDPRQRPYFKSRYFMYEGKKLGQKAHIPQEKIDYLMQFPKVSPK